MIVVWLFLAVPLICLQFVVFPDHTHLLFLGGRGIFCDQILFHRMSKFRQVFTKNMKILCLQHKTVEESDAFA